MHQATLTIRAIPWAAIAGGVWVIAVVTAHDLAKGALKTDSISANHLAAAGLAVCGVWGLVQAGRVRRTAGLESASAYCAGCGYALAGAWNPTVPPHCPECGVISNPICRKPPVHLSRAHSIALIHSLLASAMLLAALISSSILVWLLRMMNA